MELVVATGTQLHDLTVTSSGGDKMVAFDENDTIRVTGTFTARGTSCSSPIQLKSVTPGNAWDLDVTGGGPALVDFVRERSPATQVVAVTSRKNFDGAVAAFRAGCVDVVALRPD